MASLSALSHDPHAVCVMRGGSSVIAHYGSVATEVAVCVKRAGLVERPELAVLELAGGPPFVDHLLDRALGDLAPAPGRAVGVGGTWCVRPAADRVLVAAPEGGLARWRELARRSVIAGDRLTCRGLPSMQVASLVGPRAAAAAQAAGLRRELSVGDAVGAHLASAPSVVVRAGVDRFLLLAEAAPGRDPWAGVCEAGRPLGLARVGHDALDRLGAAMRAVPTSAAL